MPSPKKGETVLKKIIKRAQEIREEHPNKEWKKCVSAAAREYRNEKSPPRKRSPKPHPPINGSCKKYKRPSRKLVTPKKKYGISPYCRRKHNSPRK